MAINFPTSLDNFTNPASGNTLDSPSHSLQHSDINDAVEALEAKVGIGASPAGSATSGQVLTAQGGGTALWATPSQGLTLIKTETFTAVSAVNINDVFSSTYRNYLVIFDVTTATATSGLQMRMRVSGSDNTSSEYRYNSITVADNVGTLGVSRSNGTNTLFDDIGRIDNGFGASGFIQILSPFLTNRTRIVGQSSGNDSVPANCLRSYTGNMTVTTSYTGFSLIAASGNITGQASVFGYKA